MAWSFHWRFLGHASLRTCLKAAFVGLPLCLLSAAFAHAGQVETVTLSNGSVLIMEVPDGAKSNLRSNELSNRDASNDSSQNTDDLIGRLRAGFVMSARDNSRIVRFKDTYVGKQVYIDRLLERASRYLYLAVSEAEKRGLPTELALLPVIESAYDPQALSRSQAAGIWQFVPDTGRIYGLKQNWYYDARRDPMESTRAAYDYLAKLYQTFGSWELVLASYNAGPGTVSRAMKRNAAAGRDTDFWSLNLPQETMDYVPRFLAVVELFRSPQRFNVNMPVIANRPYFRTINALGPMSLADVAEITGIETHILRELNPGLRRDGTDPQGPFHVHVPANLDVSLENRLVQRTSLSTAVVTLPITNPNNAVVMTVSSSAQNSSQNTVIGAQTNHYRVQPRDTWYAIARQFNVATADLISANRLNDQEPLSIGQDLVIPNKARAASAEIVNVALPSSDQRIEIKRRVYEGETLENISQQYQVTQAELRAWNGDLPSRLHAGQTLTLRINPSLLSPKAL